MTKVAKKETTDLNLTINLGGTAFRQHQLLKVADGTQYRSLGKLRIALDKPNKNWKLVPTDLEETGFNIVNSRTGKAVGSLIVSVQRNQLTVALRDNHGLPKVLRASVQGKFETLKVAEEKDTATTIVLSPLQRESSQLLFGLFKKFDDTMKELRKVASGYRLFLTLGGIEFSYEYAGPETKAHRITPSQSRQFFDLASRLKTPTRLLLNDLPNFEDIEQLVDLDRLIEVIERVSGKVSGDIHIGGVQASWVPGVNTTVGDYQRWAVDAVATNNSATGAELDQRPAAWYAVITEAMKK